MNVITSMEMQVCWNGEASESFLPSWGLRQGDPLSPYLFVLCMEVLSHKIKTAVEERKWQPIMLTRQGPAVSHLFFTDDLYFLGRCPTAKVG